MQVRVLGCSGSMAEGHHTTSFLVDHDLLIDAGSGVGTLPAEALFNIDHVLLTHSHLDHVLALPLLADIVIRHRQERARGPITVHALPATIKALRDHLFNDRLWPDFTRIPSVTAPVIRLQTLEEGQTLRFGSRVVKVLPAHHVVPAVGYALWRADDPQAPAWAFSGDTGPHPAIWPVLRALPNLAHWVTEVAFADRDRALAEVSGHQCPSMLGPELANLPVTVQVHLTHLKPGEWEAVQADVAGLGLSRPLNLLRAGDVFTL